MVEGLARFRFGISQSKGRLRCLLLLILEAFIAFNILIAFAEYMTATDFASVLLQVLQILFG
jgi:hypothetical protein